METKEQKPDLVRLIELIHTLTKYYNANKRVMTKKERKNRRIQINFLIRKYNSVIPKALKIL